MSDAAERETAPGQGQNIFLASFEQLEPASLDMADNDVQVGVEETFQSCSTSETFQSTSYIQSQLIYRSTEEHQHMSQDVKAKKKKKRSRSMSKKRKHIRKHKHTDLGDPNDPNYNDNEDNIE